TGYSTAGSDIYQLKAPRTLTTEILQPVLDKQPDLVLSGYPVIQARDYSPWSSLEPRWWEPLLLLAEDQSEIGFATSGNDALGLHNYAFSFAWDTVNEYATGSAVYAWSNRLYIGAQRSSDILLDANGDFAIARQDDDVFFIASFPCTQIDSSWNISLAALSRHSRDARREPWIMPLPDSRDGLAGLAVGFNNSDHYIRSVSANNGRNVHFIAESSEIFSSDFSGEVYTFDWREYLSMGGQHVLALRLLAGYGTGQPDPFQLGGENTDFEMLDMLDEFSNIRFGKREYALRGYAEGHSELSGRRMQLGTMEWRFPLSLIERGYMAPPVALMQLSGSVFAERGMAWQDSAGEGYSSAGTELHGDINLFYGITVKLRLGFARGLDERLGDSRIYLSLGSAF
ncbi:MAG: hypothetical protein QG652_247, partial [Pseudomonadota bacterium]|nr:hypothetical protein [Pseudomonadota bacterium]